MAATDTFAPGASQGPSAAQGVSEIDYQQLANYLYELLKASGAVQNSPATQTQPQAPGQGTPTGNIRKGYGTKPDGSIFQVPVGGPPDNLIAPSYAPSGLIFPGGSPYKPDEGPAIMQNRIVAIRDLLNSAVGQAAIKKLGFSGRQ